MSEIASVVDGDQRTHENQSDALAWSQVFVSLFTPSWSLGLLLAICLFLPSYRGCNGQVVRLSEAMVLDHYTAGEVYLRYLLTWPLIFGFIVFAGTLLLTWSCNPQRASFLWWCFAGLIVTHTVLLVIALLTEPAGTESETAWTWQNVWNAATWLVPTTVLPVLLVITFLYCRNWFNAAMCMQLALALSAAVCSTFVIPGLLLAKELLFGGKLMIACSVGLIVSTIVQRLDGYRALTRRPTESSLRLSLKAMLMLMAVGGLSCAWVGACVFIAVSE